MFVKKSSNTVIKFIFNINNCCQQLILQSLPFKLIVIVLVNLIHGLSIRMLNTLIVFTVHLLLGGEFYIYFVTNFTVEYRGELSTKLLVHSAIIFIALFDMQTLHLDPIS